MVFTSPCAPTPSPTKPVHEWMFDYLKKNQEERPDQPMFIDYYTKEETYPQDIIDRTKILAKFLVSRNFNKGDSIMAAVENGWEYICMNLATAAIGGAISGANVAYTEHELTHQARLSSCKIVLCQDYVVQKILNILDDCPDIHTIVQIGKNVPKTNKNVTLISIHAIIADETYINDNDLPQVNINLTEDVFSLPTSSGTTGLPKGVKLTHYANVFAVENFGRFLTEEVGKKIEKDWDWRNETCLLALPMGFGYGQCVASCCMMNGTRGIMIKGANTKDVADAIDKYNVSIYFMAPMMLIGLLHHKKQNPDSLKSLKIVVSAGGPIKEQVATAIEKYFYYVPFVGQLYGTTETMCIASHDARDKNPLASVGRLMPNVELRIIDSNTNTELGINEPGDIQVKVSSSAPGYINNPEANKELYTSDGFLDIGDVGYIDEKGFLYLVDRKKEMLKVGGRQASPSELEDILMTHPLVQDCAIVGMPDPLTDQRITGFVVRRDHSLTEEECLKLVNSKVSEFKQITGGIHFMDAIPRNANGKILRRKIKENFVEIATK
ncbi:unnamed protein product [Bursaphelenchus okinawaensis]|uniref:AMP-binding domain-containing protein n=1 Tax=Bursaphelenchus okinawaensis TaxID=465554 RepID=A0A811LM44_9BILA|nr:unnamed protein product [Bursaphelenchus okinawaensis]CAG9123955.1 unnamed protein product [Bursaphelenchus okinawaensis]